MGYFWSVNRLSKMSKKFRSTPYGNIIFCSFIVNVNELIFRRKEKFASFGKS